MTTLLLVGSAVAVYVAPGAADVLVFDRHAILAGEWWRLMTGNLVHFSVKHLVYDGLAVGIAGALLEHERAPRLALLWLAAALSVGVTALLGPSELVRFGGLSGIAYALVTALALRGVAQAGTWRWLCVATLALVAAKLGYELTTARFLFVPSDGGVIPVPASHAAGVVAALVLAIGDRLVARARWDACVIRHAS